MLLQCKIFFFLVYAVMEKIKKYFCMTTWQIFMFYEHITPFSVLVFNG